MGTAKATIGNNNYIGAFGIATDSFILMTGNSTATERSIIEEALGVKSHQISVDGSSLVGVYVVANSKGILVPEMTDNREILFLFRRCRSVSLWLRLPLLLWLLGPWLGLLLCCLICGFGLGGLLLLDCRLAWGLGLRLLLWLCSHLSWRKLRIDHIADL